MTTLPQTTSVRSIRPVSQAPANLGYPAGPAAPAAAAATTGMTGADFWRVIRANIWLILILLIVALGIGCGVYWYLLRNYPKYTATGFIQVVTTQIEDPIAKRKSEMDQSQLTAELRTQATLLRSEDLIATIFKSSNSKIRETAWFKQFAQPKLAKEDLLDNFRVSPVIDSKLLRIEMQWSVPKECTTIVEEMVDTHLARQKSTAEGRVSDQIKVLGELAKGYRELLHEQQTRLAGLQRRLHEEGFGRTSLTQYSLKEREMIDLSDRLSKAQGFASEANRMYDSVMQAINEGRNPPQVEKEVDDDFLVRYYRQNLSQLRIEREVALKNWGPGHRVIQDIDKRIEETQKTLDQAMAETGARFRNQFAELVRDQKQRTNADAELLQKKMDEVRMQWANISNVLVDLLTLQEDEKMTRELSRQVNDQLRDLKTILYTTSASRVEWVAKPQEPEIPSFPKLPVTLVISGLCGLVLALGISFLREFLDTTVRTPRDLVRAGVPTILAIIPDESDDPQAMSSQLAMVIFEAPHSITAESFRQMRTRLQHAASLDTTRSIMVTGPSPADGKTTVACNLAAGLALNGRKILLVDGNFRRPDIHRIFRIGNDQGFSDVLNGTAHFDDVVHETQVPNLSVMASGPKPLNPTELFESQLLIDFIERALEEYDHVIFDSGPLLVVSESVAMAPRVDGVVTVVRAHSDTRGVVSRMREELRRIKAEHLGIVLNAIQAQGGGYYRSNIRTYYEYQSNV